jgi:hypothetical protein
MKNINWKKIFSEMEKLDTKSVLKKCKYEETDYLLWKARIVQRIREKPIILEIENEKDIAECLLFLIHWIMLQAVIEAEKSFFKNIGIKAIEEGREIEINLDWRSWQYAQILAYIVIQGLRKNFQNFLIFEKTLMNGFKRIYKNFGREDFEKWIRALYGKVRTDIL